MSYYVGKLEFKSYRIQRWPPSSGKTLSSSSLEPPRKKAKIGGGGVLQQTPQMETEEYVSSGANSHFLQPTNLTRR